MVASLTTLFTAREQPAVLSDMYALAATLGVDVQGVQAERLFRALYEIESRAKAAEELKRVAIAKAGFLQTVTSAGDTQEATDAWVELLAYGWFYLTRAPATKTVGIVQLACNALTASNTYGARTIKVKSTGGVVFQNAEAVTLGPSVTRTVSFEALEAGTSGNVANNAITTLVTTIGGVTVSNPPVGSTGSWITSAGQNAEGNTSLIARCLARWGATSAGGSARAYREWVTAAFTSASLTPTVTRMAVDDGNPNGPGSTDLYLATDAGPASASEVSTVDLYLQPRRSLGTGPLRVFSAPALSIPVVGVLYGNAGAVSLASDALTALQATIPIGGTVYYSALIAALMRLPGITNVALSSPGPAIDTVLSAYQVPLLVPSFTAVA